MWRTVLGVPALIGAVRAAVRHVVTGGLGQYVAEHLGKATPLGGGIALRARRGWLIRHERSGLVEAGELFDDVRRQRGQRRHAVADGGP